MGDSKIKPIGGDPFHVTKREQFVLLLHVMSKKTADKEERRNRRRLWQEFGLTAEVKKFITVPRRLAPGEAAPAGEENGVHPGDYWDNETPVPVRLTGGTVDYALKVLAGELDGATGEVLGALEDRLIRLQNGLYSPPDGLFPELDQPRSVLADAAG